MCTYTREIVTVDCQYLFGNYLFVRFVGNGCSNIKCWFSQIKIVIVREKKK
jgi:hypothetical protein